MAHLTLHLCLTNDDCFRDPRINKADEGENGAGQEANGKVGRVLRLFGVLEGSNACGRDQ